MFGSVYFAQPYFGGVALPTVSGGFKKRLILQSNTTKIVASQNGVSRHVTRNAGTTNTVTKETSITKKI